MANITAKDRIEALSKQLSSLEADRNGPSAPKRIAGPSNGPPTRRESTNSLLGIGRAAAHQFAENGARALYLCDFDDSHLAAHQRDLQRLYPEVDVHVRRFDAASSSAVKAVVDDAIKRYGRLDVFFANAGIVGTPAHFKDVDKSEFMQVVETNAASVFLAAKHAAPAMTVTSSTKPASGGSIIGTASVAGLRSNAGPTAYSAAKAAVVSIAQTCAYQLAGTGIRVNAAARARGTERKIGQLNPLKRGGQADEIARVALFLASDEASYVNGQAWAVDGGLSAGHPFVPGKIA
ncbi:uncharacterized protein PG986_008892 [Apiospora aurea]|uniref:Uncharacterized protein n=1 Tax=Apiospora aurea TaxID=335848 RepID=A0ABR1Q628_9PEZI